MLRPSAGAPRSSSVYTPNVSFWFISWTTIIPSIRRTAHLDMAASLATVGIISIGEMGLGIAKLLVASGYRVTTNATGRRHVIY